MLSSDSIHSPVTPAAKQVHSTTTPRPKDSPFSDYFTDDGHSNGNDSAFRAPSVETQQLLVRLNKLQAQLMRSSPEDVLSEHEKAVIVGRKISEIETQFHALNSQTRSQSRLPAELEDSGLFIDDDDDDDELAEGETPDTQVEVESFERAAKAFLTSVGEGEDMTAKQDTLLRDARKVLENVSEANERLRKSYAEACANHEQCASQIDALEAENAKLQSSTTTLEFENAALQSTSEDLQTEHNSLRTDLSFNRAELLFLRLRHRGLEVQVESLNNGANSLAAYAPELMSEIQQVKRAKIRQGMSRWEEEWESIDQRMRERGSRYGLSKEPVSLRELLDLEDANEEEEELVEITETTEVEIRGEDSVDAIEDELDPNPSESIEEGIIDAEPTLSPLPDDRSKPTYTSQATQTSPLPSPATSSWVMADHADAQSATNGDCAITTSSEDNGDSIRSDISTYAGEGGGDVEAKLPTTPPRVMAWRELWEGLQNLAGMGEGY